MESKKFSEVLGKAVAGESDAVEHILFLFMPLINKYSIMDGQYDEDMRQYIIMRVLIQIRKFNPDVKK